MQDCLRRLASRLTLFIMALMLMPPAGTAADMTKYSALVGKVRNMPSPGIMDMAASYADRKQDGEAVVLYAVVYGRYNDDMTDEDKNLCALAYKQAGMVYYNRGDYVNALDLFISGVKVSERCRDPKHTARLYNNIANVYCLFLDYEKGVDYYLKAYDFCRKHPDREVEHIILVNLTGMYSFLRDLPNARKYYALSERTKDKTSPVDTYMSGYTLSLIQIYEGKTAEGIARLKRLAAYAVKKGIDPRYQCFAYQELYNAYDATGAADSTLKYLRLCDETARRHDLQHMFASTLKNLSAFYNDKGDAGKASMYWSRYQTIMDSIYNMREFDAVKNSLFTYEVDKTTREMADLKAREEEKARTIRIQRITMAAVAAGTLLLALFLLIVLRQKRKLNRSYTDLYKVNRNFVDTQEQLTARLRSAREALGDRDSRIARLQEELARMRPAPAEQPQEQAKYQTSSLTGQQSAELAERIQNVMENTTAFCDCDFSLDALADLVGSNKKYVSQVINDTFGKSFNNYINPYRIHLACARFADTGQYGNLTMKAIAESVGFKSYTSFVNIFRKVTGITPSLYQKMALNDEQTTTQELS